eukprot:9474693-Pyramimonas_sp.AAC.2
MELRDLTGGKYEGELRLDQVALMPYKLCVFRSDPSDTGPQKVLAVECVHGPTSFPQCKVHAEQTPLVVVAGEVATFAVLRRDFFGNPVVADAGEPPFSCEVIGPATPAPPVEIEDQGNGYSEVYVFLYIYSLLAHKRVTQSETYCKTDFVIVITSQTRTHAIRARINAL